MVHCLVLPLFLTTLPIWGFEVLENVYVEMATTITAFLIGGWAIVNGYRKHHKNLFIVGLFTSGLLLMLVAGLRDDEIWEILLKGIGAVFVILAHVRNWRQCRACAVCENGTNKAKALI
jgi:hypothetical protein